MYDYSRSQEITIHSLSGGSHTSPNHETIEPMRFKTKKKGGLESLRSLVSSRLKETDAVEIEDYMPFGEDARDDTPPAKEAITSAAVVSPSPGEYDDLFQSLSDDSLSMRTFDRYGIVDLPTASTKDVRDLPSHSIDRQLEEYSSYTKSLPMVKRVSFSQESHQVLEFEMEDSVSSFMPNDVEVGKQPGEGVSISPEKVGSQSLGRALNSCSLADSLEDTSVKEVVFSDPTPTAGATTAATSKRRVVVEGSIAEHPGLSADKMDTDSEISAALIVGKVRESATKDDKKRFRFLGLKKKVKTTTASATPKPTTTMRETTDPKPTTNPKPSITEEEIDTPDTTPVAEPDSAPLCDVRKAAATVVAILWIGACLALPMYCATAESCGEDNDSTWGLEESKSVTTDDTKQTTSESGKRRVRQSSIMPRNISANEEDEEASFFGGSIQRSVQDWDQDDAESKQSSFFDGSIQRSVDVQNQNLGGKVMLRVMPRNQMSKVLTTDESQEEGKVVPRKEPQSQMSTVMPTEEPQDQAGKVLPKEKPKAGKKGMIRILSFKKNKKKEKQDMKSVFPAMPVIKEVAPASIVAEEPIATSIHVDDSSYQKVEMNEDREASILPPWCSWEFICGDLSICNSSQTTTTCATGATPHHVANAETTPNIDLVAKEEPTPALEPIFEEEPTPEVEETTEADDKTIDVDDCSYQKFEMNENREDSSLPPWWSWNFMCGDFSICSCSQNMTSETGATPYHDEMSFDTTITSYTRTITSAVSEKKQ